MTSKREALDESPRPGSPQTAGTAVAGEAAEAGPADTPGNHVGLTLRNVPSAAAGIASVSPDDSIEKAITVMRLHDYSQLAVMSGQRTLRGAITWRSIAKAFVGGGTAQRVAMAVEPATVHPSGRDLVDVLGELFENDFVFVKDKSNHICGIVTAADVVALYGETATPFFIIGEIDHLLRAVISERWTFEEVAQACDPDGSRALASIGDLSFGDYQYVLADAQRFDALEWPLHRQTFIKRLDEVRRIRNAVAHFRPNQLKDSDVATLKHFLTVLRELRGDTSSSSAGL